MTGPGRHALVVVTSRYEDAGLGALRAPVQDAAGLAEVLGDASVGDFDVEVLTDPTVQRLRLAVEDFFADRSAKDTLLLHFSCHGVKNAAGKLFLAASDTYRTRLAATAIPAEYVSSLMLDSRAQRAVLLLDCCYAGAFERGMIARAGAQVQVQESFQDLERTVGKRGRAVFTASSALEYAFEGDQPVSGGTAGAGEGPSLFTGALVEGLRTGEADLDHDGEVGMSELADYVNERIRERTPHQTPQLWLFGTQGDLTIAHTGRRRVVATELPIPLADAVRSDSRERKLWSVEDLGTLLCGADVGVALAAHAALSELAADDSRRVAERATRALALAAPGVDTPAVEVGLTEAAVVKVTGPPIVLATLEARTDPWLKVRYLDTGIELVPATGGTGAARGNGPAADGDRRTGDRGGDRNGDGDGDGDGDGSHGGDRAGDHDGHRGRDREHRAEDAGATTGTGAAAESGRGAPAGDGGAEYGGGAAEDGREASGRGPLPQPVVLLARGRSDGAGAGPALLLEDQQARVPHVARVAAWTGTGHWEGRAR